MIDNKSFKPFIDGNGNDWTEKKSKYGEFEGLYVKDIFEGGKIEYTYCKKHLYSNDPNETSFVECVKCISIDKDDFYKIQSLMNEIYILQLEINSIVYDKYDENEEENEYEYEDE